MPFVDILTAALSRPAGRVVEGPIRTVVAEVLADLGYASPEEVAALRTELERLQGGVADLAARLEAAERQARDLAVESAHLRDLILVAEAARHAAGRPAPAACKVEGCAAPSLRQGFCRTHAHRWLAGRLAGFVTPEGLVDVDGRPFQVDPALAGEPFQVTGTTRRLARVAGQVVRKAPLSRA